MAYPHLDMNIIEPILDAWHTLKTHCLDIMREKLCATLQEEWGRIDSDYIAKLYDSLLERVAALKKAKGGSTRY